MSNISSKIVEAFLIGNPRKIDNSVTDGESLYLFGNKIAEHRHDGLYITNAGWTSKTTKDRLNHIPNVSIVQKKKVWYLNGEAWDGSWVRINDHQPPTISSTKSFVMISQWISTDGWRGYEQPKYALAGANDTGMFDDSPCPSNVSMAEIDSITALLKSKGIPSRQVVTQTSNVFCIHHYVVVPPYYVATAREVVREYLNDNSTRLLYPIGDDN